MRATTAWLTAFLLLAAPLAASAQSDPSFEFLGFAKDGEHFLVKKQDGHEGWSVSVRSLFEDKQVKSLPLDDPNDPKRLASLTRKYTLDKGTGPLSPDGGLTVLGVQDGRYFDVLVMEKPRIGRFKSLRLETDEAGKKALGEAYLKKAAWSADGKWLVVVMTEQAEGERAFARDHVHAFKFQKWKVKWFVEEGQ